MTTTSEAVGMEWRPTRILATLAVSVLALGALAALGQVPKKRQLATTSTADCAAWKSEDFFSVATVEVVAACLQFGANPNAVRDAEGWTSLHYAVRDSENPAIIAALVAAGADPNARDFRFWKPLHIAAGFNPNPAIITALVTAGADPNAWRGAVGTTPLHMAARLNPNPAIITALVAAGADPNARTPVGSFGKTPLHVAAAENENPAIIAALLDAGADIEAQDASLGLTPLHVAARSSENPAIIAALLDAGADPKARSGSRYGRGKTPWDYAKDRSKPIKDSEAYRRLRKGASTRD